MKQALETAISEFAEAAKAKLANPAATGQPERLGLKRTSLVYKMQKLGIARASNPTKTDGSFPSRIDLVT
jgi:hypothetical protein